VKLDQCSLIIIISMPLARVQPRLQLLGSVVPNGFCSGNVTPTTAVTPVSDLTFLAFPCSLNTWAGFAMSLEARGHDIAQGQVSQVRLRPSLPCVRRARSLSLSALMIRTTRAGIGSRVCVCVCVLARGRGRSSEGVCVHVLHKGQDVRARDERLRRRRWGL
jgi:hypothetical protein